MARQSMTQRKLASKLGSSQQYVSKILKGNENLTLETVSKLEDALQVMLFAGSSLVSGYASFADSEPCLLCEPEQQELGDYEGLFREAVTEIENARLALARQISTTVSSFHWNLGQLLFAKKLEGKYGSGIVQRLSLDLKERYPSMGLSSRNLWNMKRFYERYRDGDTKLLRAVAVLPWRHNLLMMDKKLSDEQALFYATETREKGWSREMLLHAIKGRYFESLAETPKTDNFKETLPAQVAAYAEEVFRSKYNMGFLGAEEPLQELELERRLIQKISRFILELGTGFSFIGNQHVLILGEKEYRVDMLFFHRRLRRMVAIDLKVGEFKPEYVGKMNFYLSLLDRTEKATDEEPSIGLILCAEKDRLEVEVALQDVHKPIGVAEYQYLLPKEDILRIVAAELKSTRK